MKSKSDESDVLVYCSGVAVRVSFTRNQHQKLTSNPNWKDGRKWMEILGEKGLEFREIWRRWEIRNLIMGINV